MSSVPKDKFGISALDEIFTGTLAEDGAELAQASARRLGSYRNAITLFATHFPNVTELESEGDRYVNFKVVANLVDGKIVSPYTLERGISTQRLGFEIAAQNGLNPEIIREARNKKKARNKNHL